MPDRILALILDAVIVATPTANTLIDNKVHLLADLQEEGAGILAAYELSEREWTAAQRPLTRPLALIADTGVANSYEILSDPCANMVSSNGTDRTDAYSIDPIWLQASARSGVHLSYDGIAAGKIDDWDTRTRNRSEVIPVRGSLHDAIDAHDIPEGFASEIAALIDGHVDLPGDLTGGETIALAWEEETLSNGAIVASTRLSYARLDLGDRIYEVAVTDPEGELILLENGVAVQAGMLPLDGGRLSSRFGNRTHPVSGRQRMHTGVDYAAPVGTPVFATGAGSVIFTGNIRGYGRTVDIEHGDGVVTRYAHLSKISKGMAPGTHVSAGDQIGAVGATGLVSGPNLHYEVRVDGNPINPLNHMASVERDNTVHGDNSSLYFGREATAFAALYGGG